MTRVVLRGGQKGRRCQPLEAWLGRASGSETFSRDYGGHGLALSFPRSAARWARSNREYTTVHPANASHRGASIMLLFEPVRVFLQTRGLLQQARSAAGHGGQWSLPRLSRRRVSAAKRGRERASGLWAWCPIRLRKCRTGPPDRGREIQLPETGFRPSPRRSSAESKAEGRSAFRVWKCRPGRSRELWPCVPA